MFGGNVTSSWGTPQQNQPQQQQSGAFGQPAGFGASGTGAFGQQPAQQPQANPMFGNLGGSTTQSTGTGFGAFGAPASTSQSSTSNPMFGATKQGTGFGAFGGGSTFGGGGTFGQSTSTPSGSGTTSIFGQPAAAPSAFGGGTGLFGANKPTTAFGATTGGAQGTAPPVTTGSSNPPYSVYQEKDNNIMAQYQAISCMPAYAGTSHEEIRLQDYAQGRKTAGAFGQSAAFGTAQPATGIFGAQPTQQQQPSAFGGTTTTGGFGAFGAPATSTAAPAASTGLFGGGTFGQPQQQQPQQTSAFGAFGAPAQQQQQPQAGGLFGGTFGSTAAKPTGFGTFGGGTTGTSAFGGGGAFGQPQPQQQQQQQPQQPVGGLFGSTQTQAPTGFGGFGTTGNKSIFGSTQPATTQPATTGFGTFGNVQQQQTQQPQGQPSLFGGGTSLFGGSTQQQPQTTQPAANPLFGGGTTGQTGGTSLFGGGGLFGGATQQQQQQPQQQPGQTGGFGSLFGANKPATSATQSPFGGFNQQPATQPQQSIFGTTVGQSTTQPSTLGGGLFGAKPAAPSLGMSTSTGQGGLFGSSNLSGGLFNAPGAQGSLTASISQPIGADLPIFDILPPGPRLVNLETSQPKKKAGFFVDIPTRSPVPRVQLGYTPATSKLRGFGSSTSISSSAGVNPFAASLASSTKSNTLALSRMTDNKTPTGPEGFLLGRSASPALGSGGRQSVKKVILDKKVDPSELFIKSGGSPGLGGGKVIFSPALSAAVREKEVQASLNPPSKGGAESPTPAPRPQRTPNRFTAQSTQQLLADEAQGSAELEEGDYWVNPDLATLKQTGYDQLSSFNDLKVGRVGYGEIHFLEPVDLTGLPKLGALLGEVVRFDEKECSVYPDSEDVDKPPPGSGLNVKAKITLLHCWAVDKATREPIKDEKHPVAAKHLKRLRNMKDTHFESFDIADGKWTFTVDHF